MMIVLPPFRCYNQSCNPFSNIAYVVSGKEQPNAVWSEMAGSEFVLWHCFQRKQCKVNY